MFTGHFQLWFFLHRRSHRPPGNGARCGGTHTRRMQYCCTVSVKKANTYTRIDIGAGCGQPSQSPQGRRQKFRSRGVCCPPSSSHVQKNARKTHPHRVVRGWGVGMEDITTLVNCFFNPLFLRDFRVSLVLLEGILLPASHATNVTAVSSQRTKAPRALRSQI